MVWSPGAVEVVFRDDIKFDVLLSEIDNVLQKGDFNLRRNGTLLLFDALPFEINNENYFLLIGIICTLFGNSPLSAVGCRVG